MPAPKQYHHPDIAVGQVWESRRAADGGRRMLVVGQGPPGRWLMRSLTTGRNSVIRKATLLNIYKHVRTDGFYEEM